MRERKGTYPHCIRTKEKKYTLCASSRRSSVRRGQFPYPSARDEKGTPFDCKYQKELFYNIKSGKKKRELGRNSNLQGTSAQGFDDSQESVCLQEKPLVYQSISLDISRFPKQESLLGLLQAQTESGKHISLYEVGLTFSVLMGK